MLRILSILAPVLTMAALALTAPSEARAASTDTLPAKDGDITVGLVGHGSLWLGYKGLVIQIDPYSKAGDYSQLPKADLVLITHEHRDHLDKDALALAAKPDAMVIANTASAAQVPGAKAMANGEIITFQDVTIKAVPAYNVVHKRPEGQPFHPKGDGNGYLITLGGKTLYVAGDTEDIPEMTALHGRVDAAFLPVNLPYTMTPDMLVHAAKMVSPRILYPYHTGDTDIAALGKALEGVHGVEVRIKPMK